MTPQDHWDRISSDPRLRSDSTRGWNFTPYPDAPLKWRWIVLVAGVALIAAGLIWMRF